MNMWTKLLDYHSIVALKHILIDQGVDVTDESAVVGALKLMEVDTATAKSLARRIIKVKD